jgi:hypothetical protein
MANTTDMDGPQPGDRGVCIMCFTINVVGDDGKLRLPTHDEATVNAHDPDLHRIIQAMRALGPPPRSQP